MNRPDEAATETQLSRLGQLGCRPGYLLTKGEALHLITWLEQHHHFKAAAPDQGPPLENTTPEAYLLKLAVASVKRGATAPQEAQGKSPPPELEEAIARRQEFWIDTCREATQMRLASMQVRELYQQHGCRFSTPKPTEAQQILDALDSAMPSWELNHPALFYQTLELNFPELVRHH